jgi:hypothetical protein
MKARNWRREFDNYADASIALRKRLLRNFNFYDGIDHGQWEPEVVAALEADGKPAHTFNWVQNMVDTIMGHLKQEPFGISFLQQGRGLKAQGDTMQSLYDMDFERGQFQKQFDSLIRNGLILEGVVQIVWDTTDDRLGNVGFVSKNPKHIIQDPYWNSDDIRDCRAVFSYSWLTAEQIKATWNTKSQAIDDAIQIYEYDTQQNNPTNADRSQPYFDEDGNLYKVIECYYCQTESVRKVIDSQDNSEVNIDLEQYKGMTDEVLKTVIGLKNKRWLLVNEPMLVTRICTFVPGIDQDLLLEEGLYPIQLGQLPFEFFFFKDNYEKKAGLVDKLIDPAVIFNKRQSLVSHALGGAAGAGNFFIEKSVFGGDQDRIADFEARISMNGQAIEVNDDALKEKRIEAIDRPQMPLDVLKSTEDQRNYLNDLSMITPGMLGYAEQADESGALYSSKVRQAMIGLETLADSIKAKYRKLGYLYEKAARVVYSGPSRVFVDRTTNEEFVINRVMLDQEGNVVPMNVVDDLPQYLVKIEEKRNGKSKREEAIQQQVSLLQYVKNPVLSAALEGQIAAQLQLGDAATATLTQASDEWMKFQLEQVQFQRKQMSAPPAAPQGASPSQAAQQAASAQSPAAALGLA